MYCKFCGSEIGDNDLFCPKCGKNQSENNTDGKIKLESNHSQVGKDNYNSNIIYRAKSSTGVFGRYIFLIFLFTVFFAVEVSVSIFTDEIFRKSLYSSERDFVRILLIIAAITDAFIIIIMTIKANNVRSSYLCVTESGIYGQGCSRTCVQKMPFNLTFNQITNLKVDSENVYIESAEAKYKCPVSKPYDIADQLEEFIPVQRT